MSDANSITNATVKTTKEKQMEVAIYLSIFGIIYFFPVIVAASKNRSNTSAIVVTNLFLGWTVIGWVIALIWATTDGRKQ